MPTLYFPNLNGLRFLAAAMVIVHHTEQFKSLLNLSNVWDNAFIQQSGKLGVMLFFVLSGFLITYLLLNERDRKGRISLRNFYVRRILKIWPLYFLIVALGFFIMPSFEFFRIPGNTAFQDGFPWKSFISYIFMFPNLALSNFHNIPYASQAWSIGTEEQFYLIWPLIFIFLVRKELPAMAAVILGYFGVKVLLFLFKPIILGVDVLEFWKTFSIDCMAIGGITAYSQYYKLKLLNFLKNDFTFAAASLLSVTFIALGMNFGYIHAYVYSTLFAIIILNLACNEKYNNLLEQKTLNYLGTISYGLYMYHSIAIVACLKLAVIAGAANNFVFYPAIFILTILISHVSFKFFEKPVLKLKSRFL